MTAIFDNSILLYFLIFFGKLLEVSVSTIRIVLISRGDRIRGAIIAIFESALWLLIAGVVLIGFQDDPLRCLMFVAAFALGTYLGSLIEEKLAFGLCSIQVIVANELIAKELMCKLREEGYAVTHLRGNGKDGSRELLILHLKRRCIPHAVDQINSSLDNAMITINDTKIIRGGFIKK